MARLATLEKTKLSTHALNLRQLFSYFLQHSRETFLIVSYISWNGFPPLIYSHLFCTSPRAFRLFYFFFVDEVPQKTLQWKVRYWRIHLIYYWYGSTENICRMLFETLESRIFPISFKCFILCTVWLYEWNIYNFHCLIRIKISRNEKLHVNKV